ncbi:MAG: hypothetical protein GY821_15090, partial [Gammaproteobacteria bacterium]|nr:hypothetical protein [Gammaproteobacteria bacterium]
MNIAEQKPLEEENIETEFPPGEEPKPSTSRVVQFKSPKEVEPLWHGIDDGAKKVVSPLDEGPIKISVVPLSNVQPPTPGTGWQLTPTSPWSCPNQRTIVPPKQSVIFTNLGQEHLNSMDRLLWDNIVTTVGVLPNIRLKGELPYEKVLMKEYTRGLQQSVCPTMPMIRLAISIEDMGEKIDRDYRSAVVGSRGEELKHLEGESLVNPKYSQHLRDMVQFHSLKKFMDINDSRFDYTDEQKSGLDPTFSSADLICAQCLQTSAPMPKGEFSEDAMKISNMYMQIFGDPPGRCVSDMVHSRATYLDGLRDLYQMAKLTGDKLIVALHFQEYFGPVASEPFEDARLKHQLDSDFETRLRQENWALPSQLDKPMAVLMVIQAFRGPPVVFKMSDFARFDPVQRKYR